VNSENYPPVRMSWTPAWSKIVRVAPRAMSEPFLWPGRRMMQSVPWPRPGFGPSGTVISPKRPIIAFVKRLRPVSRSLPRTLRSSFHHSPEVRICGQPGFTTVAVRWSLSALDRRHGANFGRGTGPARSAGVSWGGQNGITRTAKEQGGSRFIKSGPMPTG
jgi:hypothetical protein